MYPVSTEFLDKIKASIRQVYGRVQIDYTDPFIDQSITASASENANVSFPGQTANSISNPDRKWFSLDGSCTLDGTYYLIPTNGSKEIGWWGSQLSGALGVFSATYPKLTVLFAARPLHSLKVVGDSARAEYPVDFTVKVYDASNTLLYTETVTNNTLVTWTATITPILNVTKMELEITKWSHVGRQVKIVEFFTSVQETYQDEDILYFSVLEEREIMDSGVSVGVATANEISIKLNNQDRKFDAGNTQSPLYGVLKPNRRIKAWLGIMKDDDTIEEVPMGVFWTISWEAKEAELYAKTVARDRLQLLDKTTYKTSQVVANNTLYQLAVAIFADAGITSSEYFIDTELQSFTVPYGWFNVVSHREALRQIIEACVGQMYCDRDGIIRIEGPSYLSSKITSDLTITSSDIWDKDNPTKPDSVANYIEVDTNSLQPETVAQQIYNSNTSISMTAGSMLDFTVYYNSTPCIEAVASLSGNTNTHVESVVYYAWGAIITLHNSGASTEAVTITVDGKQLNVLNKERVIASDDTSIIDNGKITYTFPTNNLIQTLAMAQTNADNVLDSFKSSRRDADINWRGNPALLLSDRLTAPDYKDLSTNDYYVATQFFEYDGTLKCKTQGRSV